MSRDVSEYVTLAQRQEDISEVDWQRTAEDLLRLHGWRFIHVRDARRQNVTGFPDLFCCRGNRALAIELKKQRGRVSEAQQVWLAALRDAGVETYVFRPSDVDQFERVIAREGSAT